MLFLQSLNSTTEGLDHIQAKSTIDNTISENYR